MEQKDTFNKTSRRQVLGGLSIGLVAAQAAPVFAQQPSTPANRPVTPDRETPQGETPNQSVKQNPVNQYPSPPFPRQPQEPPGLASQMTPRPDRGETSYR